jgi:hypothetical protein
MGTASLGATLSTSKAQAPRTAFNRPRGVTVSTQDSESCDRGSNPREAFFAVRAVFSRSFALMRSGFFRSDAFRSDALRASRGDANLFALVVHPLTNTASVRNSASGTKDGLPATPQLTWARQQRHRGGSNPCGQSPMDFESISLTARTQCHCCILRRISSARVGLACRLAGAPAPGYAACPQRQAVRKNAQRKWRIARWVRSQELRRSNPLSKPPDKFSLPAQ